jgi:hypothetical protein
MDESYSSRLSIISDAVQHFPGTVSQAYGGTGIPTCWFPVEVKGGETIYTNVRAYSDDLILNSTKRDVIDQMLDALTQF